MIRHLSLVRFFIRDCVLEVRQNSWRKFNEQRMLKLPSVSYSQQQILWNCPGKSEFCLHSLNLSPSSSSIWTSSDSLGTSTVSLENNDTLADSSDIEPDSYSLHFEDRIENSTRDNAIGENPKSTQDSSTRDRDTSPRDNSSTDSSTLVNATYSVPNRHLDRSVSNPEDVTRSSAR